MLPNSRELGNNSVAMQITGASATSESTFSSTSISSAASQSRPMNASYPAELPCAGDKGHQQKPEPLWRQLPKPPLRCPVTGLSRAKICELIYASAANGFKPQVVSRSLKATRWAKRGIRLYSVPSLLAWIASQGDELEEKQSGDNTNNRAIG